MSLQSDEINDILDQFGGDITKAAEYIIKNDDDLTLYGLYYGIRHIAAVRRRNTRRDLKSNISPVVIPNKSGVGIHFDKATIQRLNARGNQFIKDWKIGSLTLGDLTKEELLVEAEKEDRAGTGHMINAGIYRALAEPLDKGQKMRSYWTQERASAAAKGVEERYRGA